MDKNGKALKYASEELKGSEEVVLAAPNQTQDAIYYASRGMRNILYKMIDGADDDGTPVERLRRLIAIRKSKSARKVGTD